METVLNKENVLLQRLSEADAAAFFQLYAESERPVTGNKTPLEFIQHIISLCNEIYSIRMVDDPGVLIGDCALHDWNVSKREIEIGGTLLPEYWGKGIMKTAFDLLISRAQQNYAVDTILAKTEIDNKKAIKFALKMGFKKTGTVGDTLLLVKQLNKNV